ncbi:MAG: alanine--glyoxylate aminotransferase family protein [Candidatus Thermoplasmatota archaeon]
MDLENNIFMLPGPVKMHPRVIRAMCVPALSHRDKKYYEIVKEIRELLKYVFRTNYEVCLFSASGTGGMDAAISNLLKKDDNVLSITNGKFGERFYEIAKVYARAKRIEFEWGKAPEIEKIDEELSKEEYKAVTLCFNESSTGLTNPAKEIGKVVKEHGALFIVDGITALGGIKFTPEEINADVVVTGSQKCIAAPPGLSALAISKEAYEMLTDYPYYLNIKQHIEKMKADDTPWTSAVPLFLAFREALRIIKEEGLENRIKRTETLAKATRDAMKTIGLKIFPDEKYASNTVTAIKYPPNITDKEFRNRLKEEYSVVIAGGQDILKGKIFRIGHMGIVNFDLLCPTIASIESLLKKMNYKIKESAINAIIGYM